MGKNAFGWCQKASLVNVVYVLATPLTDRAQG